MKKFLVSFLIIVLVFILSSCSSGSSEMQQFEKESPFSIVEEGHNYAICKHDKTGVYYIIYKPYWVNRGGISVMLNADGTPYTGEVN